MIPLLSAKICIFLVGIVILFQLCLVAGLPWGKASMGGRFPGKYPPKMRLVAIINVFILAIIAIIVVSRSGLFFESILQFSKTAIWVVVAFFLAGTIVNTITPSKIERIWAPVALIQLITSIIVALN